MRAGRMRAFRKVVPHGTPKLMFDECEYRYFLTFRVMLDAGDSEQTVYICNRSGAERGLPTEYDDVLGISEDMGSSCEIYMIGEGDPSNTNDITIRGYFCEEQSKIPLKGR